MRPAAWPTSSSPGTQIPLLTPKHFSLRGTSRSLLILPLGSKARKAHLMEPRSLMQPQAERGTGSGAGSGGPEWPCFSSLYLPPTYTGHRPRAERIDSGAGWPGMNLSSVSPGGNTGQVI